MNLFKTGKGTKAWSQRSQRNWLQQRKLEQGRERCEDRIRYSERKITELEKSKGSRVQRQIERGAGSGSPLGPMLTELAEKNAELAVYQERRALIQSQIEALANPSPQQAAERAERQNYLANLAGERLKKDELAEGALKGLRRLLEERAELTAKLLKAAEAAELTIGEDRLDARRFEELLASLPEALAAASGRWHSWFVGEQGKVKSYVLVVDEATLPESLARAGSYRFGDKMELTDEEAGELLRDICPIGRAGHGVAWSYEGPRIMPLERFEALLREATDQGEPAQDLISRRNGEREKELWKQYEPEYREAVREHRKAMRAEGLLIGGNPADD